MSKSLLHGLSLCAIALAASTVSAQTVSPGPVKNTPKEAIEVRDIGSFHIGGKEIILKGLPPTKARYTPGAPEVTINNDGTFEVFQMYVQYTRLANPKAKYPLAMWHGGGLSGVSFETTPDGREGWQMFFLRQGHDVYVSDSVERGRATWARYPEVNTTPPTFRNKEGGWTLFRLGQKFDNDPARREVYKNTKFPVHAYDQLSKQNTPRWLSSDAPTQAAYDEYVSKTFPDGVVIMAHSQGSNFAWNTALAMPEKIKGLILVEPSAAPDGEGVDLKKIKDIPVLFIFGDVPETDKFWVTQRDRQLKFHQKLEAQGSNTTWIDLTKLGIDGNSHMMMMDSNSDQIAQMIQDWNKKAGLMK